jgi:hypothetical protein
MRSCVLVLIAAACQREASAQQIETDPLGPVRCFEAVTAIGVSLAESDAITLCGGAINAAPAQCFVTATARTELSQQQAEQLCYRTTTTQPLACYANLAATNQFTEQQAIDFCASQCAAGPPPPQTSNAGCVDVAINRAGLSLQKAGQLCFGARSASPGYCFMAGETSSTLSGDQLINLCADTTHCQYPGSYGNAYGAAAATAYGSPAVAAPVPRSPGY